VAGRDTIRFLLDGELHEVSRGDPTRTVLQYLREDLHRSGTKEGCAEGDCGACTVVVAETDAAGTSLTVRAINSCIQFLPTLDGKELFTVESLGGSRKLHAVQQAMVECHGSQCGFCTPGFVMSLFALYKNNAAPTRREIDDALAGNLCRCTGYQPIVDAAKRMYTPDLQRSGDDWIDAAGHADKDTAADQARIAAIRTLKDRHSLAITDGKRTFRAPESVQECATFIEQNPDALLLAGGTDIGLWVTKQLRQPHEIIYLGNVAELKTIRETAGEVDIGAAVTLTDAMPVILRHYPELDELFHRFASPPIRNAGTLGGNIANGSPIGDTMPALMALDATLVLRCGAKARRLPLADFYVAYQKTALQQGEFLERILVPTPVPGARMASYKVSKRFDQDISAVCGAFWLLLDGDRVGDVRMAYGGMAAVPKRALNAEAALRGERWSAKTLALAAKALEKDFAPISDMRASASYRRQVCANLLRRFHDAGDGETQGVYRYGR
jgi:xanthine dehydrogenase small subunit